MPARGIPGVIQASGRARDCRCGRGESNQDGQTVDGHRDWTGGTAVGSTLLPARGGQGLRFEFKFRIRIS